MNFSTSARFGRAASSELRRLLIKREQIDRRMEQIEEQLVLAQNASAELEARIDALRHLADLPAGSEVANPPASSTIGQSNTLRGASIRRTAVRLLLDSPRRLETIHYREWFKLLKDAGYEIGGKRPDAVFLNQVARSPLVASTSRAGYYCLDLEAPRRLRRELQAAQSKARDALADLPSDVESLRARQSEEARATSEIRGLQRQLAEAQELLERSDDARPSIAA
jgi:polyhydroxyalkanoate synthesis regulator phasin